MQTAILTLHIIVCLILVVLVLLQSGRDGMGAIFGGSNSSVFGSAGAGGILVKLTSFLAALFLVTSLGYNLLTSEKQPVASSILNVQFEEMESLENPAVSGTTVPESPTEAPEATVTAPDSSAAQE